MRIISFFIALLLLKVSVVAVAQNGLSNADSKRWKKGFVVTLEGDTVKGRIKVPDFLDIDYNYYHRVFFKTVKDSFGYTPAELSSFSYQEENNGGLVTLQSVSNPEGGGMVFMRLYCNGVCRVYGITISEARGTHGNEGPAQRAMHLSLIPTEKKYIQIGGSQFFPLKRIGFKKNMKEIFSSCKPILDGLEANHYTFDNWQTLITDYNKYISGKP